MGGRLKIRPSMYSRERSGKRERKADLAKSPLNAALSSAAQTEK